MEEELIAIKNDAINLILSAENITELNEIKLDFFGKNGRFSNFTKRIQNLPKEKRPEIGKLANETKKAIEDLLEQRVEEFEEKKRSQIRKLNLDVTMPGKKIPFGHLHPVTQAIREISSIFEKIGFERVRYPEVEWDWYAFGALNFPENHPARDEWETFFVNEKSDQKLGPMILTPHTSSGQVREMQRKKPPIRMLNIAKCYRRQSDVSHNPVFHQFEGLVVDHGIAITHLKGTLDYFVRSYFGKNRKSRIRPYHFQFTEPSFEIDVSCDVCGGTGKISTDEKCRLCKEGWLEMGGAGMVHPRVLENGGIDPQKYTGFAFGWGVERVLMMKEGIKLDDIRILYSNDLEFLQQF
jgi:phenylalanyl-tRNA synthetase alpha chain